MKHNNILVIFLSVFFIQVISSLKCGDEEIANCLECATGDDEIGTCAKCEDNYFQFLYNYLCLPCDHMTYGDSGCQGNCKIDNNLGFVCDEFGCKNGFYSLDKISCQNCNSISSPNCGECSYLPPEGESPDETDVRIFDCQKCINNKYAVFPNGRCYHCRTTQDNCADCHFEENNITKAICDRCDYDYYLKNEECVSCHHYHIDGGYCRRCTDDEKDYNNIYCYCDKYYTKTAPTECTHCPIGCDYCTYDKSSNKVICKKCGNLYTLNSQKTCTFCGIGCSYCSLDKNENPICSYCLSGYKLIDGKCYKCPPNCETCHLNEEKNEFICDECFYYSAMNSNKECFHCPENCLNCEFDINEKLVCTKCYYYGYDYNYIRYGLNASSLCEKCPTNCERCGINEKGEFKCQKCDTYYSLDDNSICQQCPNECGSCFWNKTKEAFGCIICKNGYALKDEQCLKCETIPELGEGCDSCSYDISKNKFNCYSCKDRNFAFSENTYECISNTNSTNTQLYGCLRASINFETKKYECNICKPEFIPILNEKKCLPPLNAGLQSFCREANNIGTELEPIYSCLRCKHRNNTNVTDYRGAYDCYERINDLILCKKATRDETGNVQCVKCIGNFIMNFSETYNKEICNINCEPDAFMKNFWCYKCDDKFFGNPGCVREKGCEYISSNDQLNCNECKVGYFQYTHGQCFQCKEGSAPCLECHVNTEQNRFECDKCIDGYFINDDKKCQVITCDEHPEVTPGCIICIDKLDEYKSQKKCQACKEGYFKTKDGTCINCKAKNNGGPACELCEYALDEDGNETDNIKCKYCPEGFLTTDGKCYRCEDELEDGCQNCTLKVNDVDKTEKLICTNCYNNYILSNNSHCIHYNSYVKKIPFCSYQKNYLEKILIVENTTNISSNFTPNEDDDFNFNNRTNLTKYKYKINSYCYKCIDGYTRKYESETGEEDYTCYPLDISNCSFSQMFLRERNENEDYYEDSLWDKYYLCSDLCEDNKYVRITYYYETTKQVKVVYEKNETDYEDYYRENNTNNIYDENDKDDYNESDNYTEDNEIYETRTVLRQINVENFIYDFDTFVSNNSHLLSIASKAYLCFDNLGTGNEFSPENLRKCRYANYYENNDTYECTYCLEGYSLDEETKLCKQSIKVNMNLRPGFSNCYFENIGTDSNPIYSCYSCYHYNNLLLVNSSTGAKFCTEKTGELKGCSEVFADTTYLNNVYNCTYCDAGYISYYNIFFEKITCQNVHEKPVKVREIDSTIFNPNEVEHVPAVDGVCENDKLFTPDGKFCYACNNRTVGMVGCKGTCTFDLKKNISLKCEEGMCKTGYIEKTKGVCEPCETINEGCIECHYEDNYLSGYYGFKRKRRFSCDQCDNGYLSSEDGTCHHCSTLGFRNCKNCGVDAKHDNEIVCVECQPGYFVNSEGKCTMCYENQIRGKNNICISCDDVENGGIEGCETCINENNEPRCLTCNEGFILLENNYTCLRISSNAELEELAHCNSVFLNENKHFNCLSCDKGYTSLEENGKIKCFSYNYFDALNPYLCQLYTNFGTSDVPKYSCSVCHTGYGITKIAYEVNNTAFCEYRNKYTSTENCTEALMIVEDGVIKINCTECIEDNVLYYHKDTDLNICKYKYFEKQCVVKYCKTCMPGNNYYCQECLPTNYEVSPLTGACIRKMETAPEVYFKDIFRFKLNQEKQIGGRMMHGPFISLRGLTNSQINTGHAFLVLLSFKLHYTRNNRNRNLEETKSIKTYCQIVESLDKTDGDPNLADFDCIGDTGEEEELSDYDLDGINESPENNINSAYGESNLNILAQNTDLTNLKTKEKTDFELKNFVDLVIFNINEAKNVLSEDYHFDFTIEGKLNKELAQESIEVQIPLGQVQNKTVGCTFNIKENKNADLKCDLNLEEYKNNNNKFSLKVTEITDSSNNPIYLSRLNEVSLIHEEDDSNNTVLIILVVIVCVVVIAGGVVLGIFLYKRYKKKKMQNLNIDNSIGKDKDKNIKEFNFDEVPESKENVIKYSS